MSELKNAITVVEIIIAVLLILLLGDYLGHKTGRGRLVAIVGGIALVTILAFAIFAAIRLA